MKPENVLLSHYGRAEVKLIDFGSSCFITDRLTTYTQSRCAGVRCLARPELILPDCCCPRASLWVFFLSCLSVCPYIHSCAAFPSTLCVCASHTFVGKFRARFVFFSRGGGRGSPGPVFVVVMLVYSRWFYTILLFYLFFARVFFFVLQVLSRSRGGARPSLRRQD